MNIFTAQGLKNATLLLNVHERYLEGTHFEILTVLLAHYIASRGDDTHINIIGHRYVGAMSMDLQQLIVLRKYALMSHSTYYDGYVLSDVTVRT